MVAKGKGSRPDVPAGTNGHAAEGAAPGGFDLPDPAEIARECQGMSLVTLREAYASRNSISKKQARGASTVFRGVSVTMRTLEYGLKE